MDKPGSSRNGRFFENIFFDATGRDGLQALAPMAQAVKASAWCPRGTFFDGQSAVDLLKFSGVDQFVHLLCLWHMLLKV
ncbi:MAG: hypothetical protein JJD98_12830 [Polaromonas sp.]|nr:hypothetical protein [Polaromonas sp.]